MTAHHRAWGGRCGQAELNDNECVSTPSVLQLTEPQLVNTSTADRKDV